MYISAIKLRNFRNYNLLEFNPGQGICIFIGDNAQGKTNLLEAVALLSTCKSHRTKHDRDMIMQQSDFAFAHVDCVESDGVHTVEIVLSQKEKKRIRVNGLPVSRAGDMLGQIKTVTFSPEDLDLIKAGPSFKRRFMDIDLSQTDSVYFYNLSKYNHILEQRNNLLKQIAFGGAKKDALSVWDEMLACAALPVLNKRAEYINRLAPVCSRLHSELSVGQEKLECRYLPGMQNDHDAFLQKLTAEHYSDIKHGATNSGVHKDDIGLMLQGNDLRVYGSQGQQRTAALALKLAQLELMATDIGEPPILLLDDVLSELDNKRQRQLLEKTKGYQVFLTTTQLLPELAHVSGTNIYNVSAGTISKR